MAEDAREVAETSREAVTTLPKKTYTPPAPTGANEYARPAQATLTDAVKSISMEDFKNVHMQPCVRNSLLYGIGTGFAFGGLRLVLGASVPRAANWAAGTFAGASLMTYEFCQFRRHREKAGMQRAIEIIDRRKAEREKQMAEKKEKLRIEREEKAKAEEAARIAAMRPWYKFW
ncbi:hypothetical protein DFP73DRAFT_595888 [Morchella snyderi]|nr:hypothetical protein DFP73DRAFT_595888 [Morchella snyderi]